MRWSKPLDVKVSRAEILRCSDCGIAFGVARPDHRHSNSKRVAVCWVVHHGNVKGMKGAKKLGQT